LVDTDGQQRKLVAAQARAYVDGRMSTWIARAISASARSPLGGIVIQFAAASFPLLSNLLGNAAIPAELWTVVFAAAFLSWGLAEVLSRLVWAREVGRTHGRDPA
jgi:hypothetical protein